MTVRVLKNWVILLLAFAIIPAGYSDDTPPNQRVVVLPGGSLDVGVQLGIVAGLIESGERPDVAITTCGSSMAGLLMNQSGDPERWRQWVESEEFYRMMGKIQLNQEMTNVPKVLGAAGGLAAEEVRRDMSKRPAVDHIPGIFETFLTHFPKTTDLSQGNADFSSSKGIRVVMLGTRLDYDPAKSGDFRKGQTLYHQAMFTDPVTAKQLQGFQSTVRRYFPEAPISDNVEVYTQYPLYSAARASMSEPFISEVMTLPKPGTPGQWNYFLAGSSDLLPIDLARHLGREVISTYSYSMSPEESLGYLQVFGFDINDYMLRMQKEKIAHWLDITDQETSVPHHRPDVAISLPFTISFNDKNYPKSYEEYREIIRKQWEYGRARAKEGLRAPEGSTAHVRRVPPPNDGNIHDLLASVAELLRYGEAPYVLVDSVRSHKKGDDQSLAQAIASSISQQAVPLLFYGLFTATTEILRAHGLELPYPRLMKRLGAVLKPGPKKVLYVVISDPRGSPGFARQDFERRYGNHPNAEFIAVQENDIESVVRKLREAPLDRGRYDRIEVVYDGKIGKLFLADGTKVKNKGVNNIESLDLGAPGAEMVILSSRAASSGYLTGRGMNLTQSLGNLFMSRGGNVYATPRLITNWMPKTTQLRVARWISNGVGYLTGWRNISNIARLINPRRNNLITAFSPVRQVPTTGTHSNCKLGFMAVRQSP